MFKINLKIPLTKSELYSIIYKLVKRQGTTQNFFKKHLKSLKKHLTKTDFCCIIIEFTSNERATQIKLKKLFENFEKSA